MTRAWWSVLTALILVALSTAVFVARWYTQGAELGGPHGEQSWKVTLIAAGRMEARQDSVTLYLPLEFRHQHIYEESFQSRELTHRAAKNKSSRRREAVWRRRSMGGSQAVRLTYSCNCVTGVRRPFPAMIRVTRQLDGPPGEGVALKPEPGIQSDSKDIAHMARLLISDDDTPEHQLRVFFDFVDELPNEPSVGNHTALECLQQGAGDSGGKSRLLAALCRNRGLPARIVTGVVLDSESEQRVHRWVEAWVNQHWVPMCPTHHYFGSRQFPPNYLVMHIGDEELIRTSGPPFQIAFKVQPLRDDFSLSDTQSWPALRALWSRVSLYSLRPGEQHVVKFLLLLPLGALIVSFYRTVIGISTFGTFGPALLGLAFLDLKALPWGLVLFVLTVLVGWCLRHLLDRFHLLLVPRIAILLTLIVVFLIVMIVVASHNEFGGMQYIGLFPLVILTHLVERFWTVETEDGMPASFKTLLGTLVVAVTVSLALSSNAVSSWMFRYPETLGLVLAIQFLLGRYTGYRLTELYRFKDLLREQAAEGQS
jgi:hypothetical protein